MDAHEETKEELLEQIANLRRQNEELGKLLAERIRVGEELQSVLNAAPVLVATAGFDGYYKRINRAFERILGHPEDVSLSKPFMEFIHPDDHAAAREQMEKLVAGESVTNFEDRNICRDGSYRWISWTVVPLRELGIVYGVGHDITEQKHAALALRESEARFRRIYESGMIGIAFWDSLGVIRVANDVYLENTGLSRQDIILGKARFSEHNECMCQLDDWNFYASSIRQGK